MSPSPILPEHSADFWTKKWLLGVVLPVPMWLYGSYSILTRHSYAMEMRNHWVPVVGWQAVFAGIFLVGLGLVLFSNCYAPYSRWFSRWSDWGTCVGLVATVVGITVAEWSFLFG